MRAAAESFRAAPPAELREAEPTRPEHEAEQLTRGGREALIRFRGQVYSLRITRQGKLLLTK